MKFLLTLSIVLFAAGSATGFNFFPSLKLKSPSTTRQIFKDGKKIQRFFEENGINVKNMQIKAKDAVSLFLGHQKPKIAVGGDKKVKARNLHSFEWSSCDTKAPLIDIHALNLQPDPLEFPGDLSIGFDVEFKDTINPSDVIDAQVHLALESGSSTIEIPCLGNLGSCKYTDLCSMLSQIQECPDQFQAENIPCKCPFEKGDYKLDNITVEIDAGVFLPGNYKGNVTMESNQQVVACYELKFTVG